MESMETVFSLQFLARRQATRTLRSLGIAGLIVGYRWMIRMYDDAFDPLQQFARPCVRSQELHRLAPPTIENSVCGGHPRESIRCLSKHDGSKHVECGFGLGACQGFDIGQRWCPETFTRHMLRNRKMQLGPSPESGHLEIRLLNDESPKIKSPQRIAPRGPIFNDAILPVFCPTCQIHWPKASNSVLSDHRFTGPLRARSWQNNRRSFDAIIYSLST